MSDTPTPFRTSLSDEANRQFAAGKDHAAKSDIDGALTWYRRAVISDPDFFDAHMQIGIICREKGRHDEKFARLAFESLRKAAGLDLANEDAHNQFILAGSHASRMEELILAYEKWQALEPENELLKRCKRNVLTLSMAMMPQQVEIAGAENAKLKRFILVGSILLVAVGFGILTITPLLVKGKKLKQEQVRGVAPVGMTMAGAGFLGLLTRRFF